MKQVEELPKLCETVLGNLNAALVFHKAFFKEAKTPKRHYMCMALSLAVAYEIISSEGSELTKSYIKLVLNKLAEDKGWMFWTTEMDEGIFQWDKDKYVNEDDFEAIDKEDLALDLLIDEDWTPTEEEIKHWWVVLISRLGENIQPANQISMGIRP